MRYAFFIAVILACFLFGPCFPSKAGALITIESYKQIQAERQKHNTSQKPNQEPSKQGDPKPTVTEIQKEIKINPPDTPKPPKAE